VNGCGNPAGLLPVVVCATVAAQYLVLAVSPVSDTDTG
jgi:hypothetical protein